MVTVYLRGGLGNQMFQYAVALALAKKNNTDVFFDTTFLNDRFPRRQFAYRDYALEVFELEQRFTQLSLLSKKMPIPGFWMGLDLVFMTARNAFGIQKIMRETHEHEFDPAVANASGNLLLWGRWQNEKYFEAVEFDLRAAFRFRDPLSGVAKEIAQEIAAATSVSLHVRRGDYASFKGVEALHGKTNLDYYQDVVKYFSAHVKNPHFFIFSDDVAWCKEHLHIDAPATYVPPQAAGPHDSSHLRLMALCNHHVIVNSTFSWWGAWLDPRPEKIVVAPKRWYADREEQPDIIPAGWIRV